MGGGGKYRPRRRIIPDTNVYGVSFTGTSPTGTRTYDAVNKNFSPSSTTVQGVDDFINIETSPFNIKECITIYDQDTGKQDLLAYKGDQKWDELVANRVGNRMIEFPRFYYRRPSRWEFQVCTTPNLNEEGWLPSPMHYRNGVMHDFVYISRYMINSDYVSQPGQTVMSGSNTPNFVGQGITISIFRNVLRPLGMYVLDYAAVCSLQMLMLIKYATTDVPALIGGGYDSDNNTRPNTTGSTENVKGLDGYSGANLSSNASIIAFGIEDFWCSANHFVDGVFRDSTTGVYINTDIESLDRNPTWSDLAGFVKVPTESVQVGAVNKEYFANISEFMYDSTYPWVLYPTKVENAAQTAILPFTYPHGSLMPDFYWSGSNDDSMNVMTHGGYWKERGGPFNFGCVQGYGTSYLGYACVSMCLY